MSNPTIRIPLAEVKTLLHLFDRAAARSGVKESIEFEEIDVLERRLKTWHDRAVSRYETADAREQIKQAYDGLTRLGGFLWAAKGDELKKVLCEAADQSKTMRRRDAYLRIEFEKVREHFSTSFGRMYELGQASYQICSDSLSPCKEENEIEESESESSW